MESIAIFADTEIKHINKAILHLNCFNYYRWYFERYEIPDNAYKFNGLNIKSDWLLDSITKQVTNKPVIIITEKRSLKNFELYKNKQAAIVSMYSTPADEYKDIAFMILHAALQLNNVNYQSINFHGQDVHQIYSTLDDDVKKYFTPIYSKELSTHHVLITHGIRTHAFWAENSQNELRNFIGASTIVGRYGVVNLITFIFSKAAQVKFAYDLLVKLINISKQNPGVKISIVAHSYGTLLIGKVLEMAEQLKLDINLEALILNGSILPRDYDWHRYLDNKGVSVKRVLNICGDSDYWPIFGALFAPGAGDSGTFFFFENSEKILNIRLSNCGHSDMLRQEIAREYWAKFIADENFVPTSQEEKFKFPINEFLKKLILFLILIVSVNYYLN